MQPERGTKVSSVVSHNLPACPNFTSPKAAVFQVHCATCWIRFGRAFFLQDFRFTNNSQMMRRVWRSWQSFSTCHLTLHVLLRCVTCLYFFQHLHAFQISNTSAIPASRGNLQTISSDAGDDKLRYATLAWRCI